MPLHQIKNLTSYHAKIHNPEVSSKKPNNMQQYKSGDNEEASGLFHFATAVTRRLISAKQQLTSGAILSSFVALLPTISAEKTLYFFDPEKISKYKVISDGIADIKDLVQNACNAVIYSPDPKDQFLYFKSYKCTDTICFRNSCGSFSFNINLNTFANQTSSQPFLSCVEQSLSSMCPNSDYEPPFNGVVFFLLCSFAIIVSLFIYYQRRNPEIEANNVGEPNDRIREALMAAHL
jgi:hypothetical protein